MATKTSKFPGLTVNPSNHRCINTALFFFSLLFFVFFHCFVFFSLLCFFVFFSLLCFFFVFFFPFFVFFLFFFSLLCFSLSFPLFVFPLYPLPSFLPSHHGFSGSAASDGFGLRGCYWRCYLLFAAS